MANGLYYKPITIINDDSSIVNKLETSVTDNARVIIYDRHMFIVQATGLNNVIPNGWEPTSCLGQVYKFKSGSFSSQQDKCMGFMQPILELKTQPRFVLLI